MLERALHLDTPDLGPLEKESLIACIDSSYVSTFGPYVPEFEKRFTGLLGVENAVALQSGTAGLHMALYELGIGPGDEVILPVLTFVATANAVRHVGAEPVLVDVDPFTWTMDPEKTSAAVTNRTKAVIPVHLFGNPCHMDEIARIGEEFGLFIIEDATESLCSTYKGSYTGTFGDFGVFSFNGNKLITTGGGGMVVGKEKRRLEHIRTLVNQARDEGVEYFHSEVGFNFRMTNLEASLGLAQMDRLNEFLQKKGRFREIYEKELGDSEVIEFQHAQGESKCVWWLNSVTIDTRSIGLTITDAQGKLLERGVPSRRIFTPLVDFPPYSHFDRERYPNARKIFENSLNLPSSTLNTDREIAFASSCLLEVILSSS
jgi:perosamine synthetase